MRKLPSAGEASPLRRQALVGFGGSYGGMLCAWLRMAAPWSLDACLSASAPIESFPGQRAPGPRHDGAR